MNPERATYVLPRGWIIVLGLAATVVLEGVLGSVASALSGLLFVLVLVIFKGLDGAIFGARRDRVKAGHEPVLGVLEVVLLYCVLNLTIQSVIQPKFVGDAVGLTTTISFLSLIVWAYLLGPLGAILAVPASLLFKAVLLDVDPTARWLQLFFGDEPVFGTKPRATIVPAPTNPS